MQNCSTRAIQSSGSNPSVAGVRFLGRPRVVAALCALLLAPCAWASSSTADPQTQRSAAPGTGKAGAQAQPGPSTWQRLNQAERHALAPLSGIWDQLSPAHRKKWLEISRNFPSLQAQEQTKMHERMREWASLSAQDRARARLNFGKTAEIARELTPAEKLAKWQAYQALPPEQRLKLAEQAKTRTLGAAPAAQPVPAQKLAVLPPPASARPSRAAEGVEDAAAAEEAAAVQ